MPKQNERATCDRCGRTVWLRRIGTMGSFGVDPRIAGLPEWQWCGRRGSKPAPIYCPVSDGRPATYHKVNGTTRYYGEDPQNPAATR